jgi:hypothetical protein
MASPRPVDLLQESLTLPQLTEGDVRGCGTEAIAVAVRSRMYQIVLGSYPPMSIKLDSESLGRSLN